MKIVRVAIAQINCTVGDLEGNSKKIIEYISEAKRLGADIVSFPELSITGYPPEDLLFKKKFIDDNIAALKKVAGEVSDIAAIVGYVDRQKGILYNAAAVIYDRTIKGIYRKMMLPNYGVFDEKRYFNAGDAPSVFKLGKLLFGVNICEDIWHKEGLAALQAQIPDLIITINASPYHAGKVRQREEIIKKLAKRNKVFISYANLVGGQDELVFDGQSMLVDNKGRIISRAKAFKEDLLITDFKLHAAINKSTKKMITLAEKVPAKIKPALKKRDIKPLEATSEIYEALVLGLKDYVKKNGFEKVIVALSGGIDSSLVATLAVDAFGSDNVVGTYMPTHYSSNQSELGAKELASNLGIKFINISIDHIFRLYLMALEPQFSSLARDITEENLQARIRGNVLMALSNKFGWLVLTTGNKSEASTGYATLYGDMAGGFAPIKDVPKMLVYKLAKYRNSPGKVIPESVITREPTAELRPDQKDRDTLPPYEKLDPILKAYIEEDKAPEGILSMGFDKETVRKVLRMVDKAEYKRRQSTPGTKITPKAFGKDRRMPITNKYRQ